MRCSRFFTLIELLVVVAIVAILMSLLMPALMQAKLAAKETNEMNLLRQIGLTQVSYADDFDETIFTYIYNHHCSGAKFHTYWVAHYKEGIDPSNTLGNGAAIRKNVCFEDKTSNAKNGWWPSFYWAVARKHCSLGGWNGSNWFHAGAAYDGCFNVTGRDNISFNGNAWPRVVKVTRPESQVLSRCPSWSEHVNFRRANLFFDLHVSRLWQPDDSTTTDDY